MKALLARMKSSGLKTRLNLPLDEFAALPRERQAEALAPLDTALIELGRESANALCLCRKEKEDADAALSNDQEELKKLREGKMVYPKASELLREAIHTEFQKRGTECDAKIFSEVLYMEDIRWQECAEAVLGFRRFDIIVSPSHYQAAKQVFAALGEKAGDVSLVDAPSLMRDSQRWSPPLAAHAVACALYRHRRTQTAHCISGSAAKRTWETAAGIGTAAKTAPGF